MYIYEPMKMAIYQIQMIDHHTEIVYLDDQEKQYSQMQLMEVKLLEMFKQHKSSRNKTIQSKKSMRRKKRIRNTC